MHTSTLLFYKFYRANMQIRSIYVLIMYLVHSILHDMDLYFMNVDITSFTFSLSKQRM